MIEKYIKNDQTLKRYRRFKAMKRSVFSLWVFIFLLFLSVTAEFWSNNKPFLMSYQGSLYTPAISYYHPSEFGIEDEAITNYRMLRDENKLDWSIWPLIEWDPFESNTNVSTYPAPPSSENLLGTDDRGRDVASRLIYGLDTVLGLLFWFGFFLTLPGLLLGPLWDLLEGGWT